MGDKRFDDRIKRIDVNQRKGRPVQMLAGVGDVKEAAEAVEGKPRASLILAVIGSVLGVWAFQVLQSQVGLQAMIAYPPEMLLEIGMSEPVIGVALASLAACALLALFSLFRGRKAFKMMSFSWAAWGGVLGGFVASAS